MCDSKTSQKRGVLLYLNKYIKTEFVIDSMALSRLENFIKNVEGNILYVNPDDLDSTDDINNQGNSLTRPFKTIQRALLEAARFSYQIGINNDKFDKTTIMLYPGEHVIDNRPGYSIDTNGSIKDANNITRALPEFTGITIFDLNNITNIIVLMVV